MSTRIVGAVIVALGVAGAPMVVGAQWLKYPTPNAPRLPNGKVNLSAPAPRAPDGKPDFTRHLDYREPRLPQPGSRLARVRRGAADVPGRHQHGHRPAGRAALSAVAGRARQEADRGGRQGRSARECLPDTFIRAYSLPHLLKFVQTPGLLVMLNEMNAGYRQVYIDGRPLPVDPVPVWQGYSTARWEGDTLVIDIEWLPRRHLDRLERQRDHRGRQGRGSASGGPTSVTSKSRSR